MYLLYTCFLLYRIYILRCMLFHLNYRMKFDIMLERYHKNFKNGPYCYPKLFKVSTIVKERINAKLFPLTVSENMSIENKSNRNNNYVVRRVMNSFDYPKYPKQCKYLNGFEFHIC